MKVLYIILIIIFIVFLILGVRYLMCKKNNCGLVLAENKCKFFGKNITCVPNDSQNPDCYGKTAAHVGCLSSKPGYNCLNQPDGYC